MLLNIVWFASIFLLQDTSWIWFGFLCFCSICNLYFFLSFIVKIFKHNRCDVYDLFLCFSQVIQFVILYTALYKSMGLEVVGENLKVYDGVSALIFSLGSLTTMSFGDYSPVNHLEEFLAYSEAVLGYLILALTVTIMPIAFKSVGKSK